MSYALELEKSLKSVAGAIEIATDGDARKHLRAAGERIIELAKSIEILPEDSAAGAPQIPEADQTEEMRKQLADAQTREADLRTQLEPRFMKTVFADTFFRAALLSPRDQWHVAAVTFPLDGIQLVTTETVLIELLNYYSDFGAEMRKVAAETVRDIVADLSVTYLTHQPEIFLEGLELFERRPAKGYSLTDSISMVSMRNMRISYVLSHDKHFEQEGFTILF